MLDRIEFRFNSEWLPSYFQRGDEKRPLHWPDVETAIGLCFLGYIEWRLSRKATPFLFGEQEPDAAHAKRLSGALYQTNHSIHNLFFGENPKIKGQEPVVSHLVFPAVRGISKSGRSKTKPLRVPVSDHFLPPDCVQVFWNVLGERALTEIEQIRRLAQRIRQSLDLAAQPMFPSASDNLPTLAPTDTQLRSSDLCESPTLAAIREALRQFFFDPHAQQLRVGSIRSPAELQDLWSIDAAAYGIASITLETFREWWLSFPLGLKALFFRNRVMGAIGIWPLSNGLAGVLKSGQIKESELRGEAMRPFIKNPPESWYVSGMVLRPDLIGTRAIKILLSEGITSWLARSKVAFPCELLALAYSPQGQALLEGFGFFCVQNAARMPDKCPLYGLELPSRQELIGLSNERGLDLA